MNQVLVSCEKMVYLVEDERLTDAAPVADGAEVMNKHQQQQHECNTGEGINGIDQEHHDQTAKNAQCAGVPCKTTE